LELSSDRILNELNSDRDKQYKGFLLTAGGLKFLQNNVQIIFLHDSNQMDFL